MIAATMWRSRTRASSSQSSLSAFWQLVHIAPNGGGVLEADPKPRPEGPSGPSDGVRHDPAGGSSGAAGQWFAPLVGPDSPGAGPPSTDRCDPSAAGAPAAPRSRFGFVSEPLDDAASELAEDHCAQGFQASPAYPSESAAALSAAGPAVPGSAAEAVRMAVAGLGWLAGPDADAAGVPVPVLAECLRGLEQVLSVHTAARARILESFTARRGFEDDGQGSPRTWLTWQTRVTRPAAGAAVSWMRRLREHPALAGALARAVVSVSWARQIADWTDALPAEARGDADIILLAAAAGGADLSGLAELAEEIRRRAAGPDRDPGDGFTRRGVWLATTPGGAGALRGDLSARCAAAPPAGLDSPGKKAGPADTPPIPQRHP